MIRNSLSIGALAMTAFLSACGGGGGGGGGTATIDTPVSITGANFARVASLAVRSNLIVADSPNFNEGYPAAVVASAPCCNESFKPVVMSVCVNWSRMPACAEHAKMELSKINAKRYIIYLVWLTTNFVIAATWPRMAFAKACTDNAWARKL